MCICNLLSRYYLVVDFGFSIMNQGVNLVGAETGNDIEIKIYKKRSVKKGKPHKELENWKWRYDIPLVCFLECGIMILFFLFLAQYQILTIHFSLDLNDVVDDYFFDGFDFGEREELAPNQIGKIYFKNDLMEIVTDIAERFFTFGSSFPYRWPFYSESGISAAITTISGYELDTTFGMNNLSLVVKFIEPLIDVLKHIEFSMTYHIQEIKGNYDQRIELIVSAVFELDHQTGVMTVDMFHNKFPKQSEVDFNNLLTDTSLLPLVIAIMVFICLVVRTNQVCRIWSYSKVKADTNFMNPFLVFWHGTGPWTVFAFLSHILSFIACVTYFAIGAHLNSDLPISLVLMAFATFFHSFLLIRYLQQKPSTMIVVNVIFHGGVSMILFMTGCIIIFAGYLVLGTCLFGSFTERFRTPIETAIVLMAVVHGDALQSMYEAVTVRADISEWVGFIYMTIWILFAITIMFNIMIAIFEEALLSEVMRVTAKETSKDVQVEQRQAFLSLPIDYKAFY